MSVIFDLGGILYPNLKYKYYLYFLLSHLWLSDFKENQQDSDLKSNIHNSSSPPPPTYIAYHVARLSVK